MTGLEPLDYLMDGDQEHRLRHFQAKSGGMKKSLLLFVPIITSFSAISYALKKEPFKREDADPGIVKADIDFFQALSTAMGTRFEMLFNNVDTEPKAGFEDIQILVKTYPTLGEIVTVGDSEKKLRTFLKKRYNSSDVKYCGIVAILKNKPKVSGYFAATIPRDGTVAMTNRNDIIDAAINHLIKDNLMIFIEAVTYAHFLKYKTEATAQLRLKDKKKAFQSIKKKVWPGLKQDMNDKLAKLQNDADLKIFLQNITGGLETYRKELKYKWNIRKNAH